MQGESGKGCRQSPFAGKRASASLVQSLAAVVLLGACGGSGSQAATGGAGTTNGESPAGTTNGGSSGAGGSNTAAGSSDSSGASSGGGFDSTPVYPMEPAKGTPGVWEEVTPAAATRGPFGLGNVVADPVHPNDLYVGGYGELWKSGDYGRTWNKLESKPNPESVALGHVIAVAGTTPATLWVASLRGPKFVYRSRDAGLTFELTGTIAEKPDAQSLYSIEVDPNDPNHLITGLHEEDGALESTDGGDSWHFVNGSGWLPGISWFLFFVKTDNPETTRTTWFAISQTGGSGLITRDAGKTWKVAEGLAKAEHPHGGGSLFQTNGSLFVAGIYGDAGNGVFRSTDGGDTFTRVLEGNFAVTWGSSKKVYSAWGWACSDCTAGPEGPGFKHADLPGGDWATMETPPRLNWGPNSVAITNDGQRTVYVGSMWATGLWRYVEP
jgi:hypothetical protein